jgi:hypothetical protein
MNAKTEGGREGGDRVVGEISREKQMKRGGEKLRYFKSFKYVWNKMILEKF